MNRRSGPTRRGSRALRPALLVVGTVLFLSSCVSNAKQDTFQPRSHYAQTIYNLIVPIFGVAGIVFVGVIGLTLFFAVKYRVPTDVDTEGEELPEPVHGNFRVELGWTITPALILLVVGAATVVSVFKLAQEPPKQNPHVQIVGQQWWWEFRYDLNGDGKYDEIVTANELVIPAGVDVALLTTSRDVIHGFWAPRLNGKRDVVPGHPTNFNIAATNPGTYFGQCTVLCGVSHANMRFQVKALSKPAYARWVKEQQRPATVPTDQLAKDGLGLFKAQCGQCHNVRGLHKVNPKEMPLTAGAAPDLTHFMTRTIFASGEYNLRKPTAKCVALGLKFANDPSCIEEATLRAWLHDPENLLPMEANGINGEKGTIRGMPNLNLSPNAIDQLVAFLKTLK